MNADTVEIVPVTQPVVGTVRPPGSKSLTNRALLIAALAVGETELRGVLDSVDTRVMVDGLKRLGIDVDANFAAGEIRLQGTSATIQGDETELWCENSGTSIRFLTALCATGNGSFYLDGNERMRQRPIGPLVQALSAIGVDARCAEDNECPPVVMYSHGLPGGTMTVSGDISSQYLSGLLMVAPAAQDTLTIRVAGELVSRPYIDMTLATMRAFGAEVTEPSRNEFRVAQRRYQGRSYEIEPDASAASYFFAVAAITGGSVTVRGLHRHALQGDVGFVDALVQMGCSAEWNADSITLTGKTLTGIDIDMNAISDTAQTLACVAPFAAGPTRIRNVAHNRVKETDRITAVVTELRRAGIQAEEHPDGMTIYPLSDVSTPSEPVTIQTYDDHRMAMSFALLGLKRTGISIADPGCTAKTYPHYFDDLEALCGAAR